MVALGWKTSSSSSVIIASYCSSHPPCCQIPERAFALFFDSKLAFPDTDRNECPLDSPLSIGCINPQWFTKMFDPPRQCLCDAAGLGLHTVSVFTAIWQLYYGDYIRIVQLQNVHNNGTAYGMGPHCHGCRRHGTCIRVTWSLRPNPTIFLLIIDRRPALCTFHGPCLSSSSVRSFLYFLNK